MIDWCPQIHFMNLLSLSFPALFVVFWLPYLVVNLHAYIFHWEPPWVLDSITETLTYGTVALDPFIYAAFYKPFRRSCKQLWQHFCQLSPNTVHENSGTGTESNHQRNSDASHSQQRNAQEPHEHVPMETIATTNSVQTCNGDTSDEMHSKGQGEKTQHEENGIEVLSI